MLTITGETPELKARALLAMGRALTDHQKRLLQEYDLSYHAAYREAAALTALQVKCHELESKAEDDAICEQRRVQSEG
jgi:hypothetical protein